MNKPKIVSIVGPTASGKTSLSIAIAKHFNGEVISADSRQIYRGLDIGSGKVTPKEMGNVPHHLLSIADPNSTYTGVDFVRDAKSAIQDILSRNHLPIIVGGTFFYTDLLQGKMNAAPVLPNEALRSELEKLSTEELFEKIRIADKNTAKKIDSKNRRRLIRALEIISSLGNVPKNENVTSPYDWLTIGIAISKENLHSNIHKRLIERLENGMIDEVNQLIAKGVTHERLESFGLEYRYINRYLRGEMTYEQMVSELETKIKQFAKRQMTWLKRDKNIEWFEPTDTSGVFTRIDNFLQQP